MPKKTYRLRVSVSTMGTLIFSFLILLALSFIAGFYLGSSQHSGKPEQKALQKQSSHLKTPSENSSNIQKIVPEKVKNIPSKTTNTIKPSPTIKEPPAKIQKTITKSKVPYIKTPYYELQVAAFKNKNNAEKLSASLKKYGYTTLIKFESGLFKVRVGKYSTYEKAKTERKKLIPLLRRLRVRVKDERNIIIKKII